MTTITKLTVKELELARKEQFFRDSQGLPLISSNDKPVLAKGDGDGLWAELSIGKKGASLAFVFRYTSTVTHKPNRISLGIYPKCTLDLARNKARAAHNMLHETPPRDPAIERTKRRSAALTLKPFKAVAQEWFDAFRQDSSRADSSKRNDEYARRELTRLFGEIAINDLDSGRIAKALLQIASEHKAKAVLLRHILHKIFRYAIGMKYCTTNPADKALFDLPVARTKGLAAELDPRLIGALMRGIASYEGNSLTRAALEMQARVFVRPHIVAAMQWDELDLDAATWTVPGAKMKMRHINPKDFRVPLSRQALAIIELVKPVTGKGKYVFSTSGEPMSTKTLNRAIHAIGFKGKHTAHGFRSTASTLLNAERRWPADIIEIQLAHGDEDKIAKIYNRQFELEVILKEQSADDSMLVDRVWELRTKMAQHWSNRLDQFAFAGTNVVALKAA